MNSGSKYMQPEGHMNNVGGPHSFSAYQPVWVPNPSSIPYQTPNPNMSSYNSFQLIPVNAYCQAPQPHMQRLMQQAVQQPMQQQIQQSMQPTMQPFIQPAYHPTTNLNFLGQNYTAVPHICSLNNTYGVPPPPYNFIEKEFHSSSDSDSMSNSPPENCSSPTHKRTIDNIGMPSNISKTVNNSDLKAIISSIDSQRNIDPNNICDRNIQKSDVRNIGNVTLLQEDFIKFLELNSKCLSLSDTVEVKHQELIYLALNGCNVAEELANEHRSRPCFNKIDNLCARLKQDVTRPNNVMSNINSQGSAWAVKDFIFAFTRIMNSWVIIKGYVNNNHEGLSNIKSEFSEDLIASFAAWQNTTLVLGANLIKTFINLNNFVHSQKNSLSLLPKVCNKPEITPGINAPSMPNGPNNGTEYEIPYSMENGYVISDTPKGGDYFKTGTYKPIQKPQDHNSTGAPKVNSNINTDINTIHESPLPVKPATFNGNMQQSSEKVMLCNKNNVKNKNREEVTKHLLGNSTITLQGKDVAINGKNKVIIPAQQCTRNGYASMNIKVDGDIQYNLNRVPLCTSTPIKPKNIKEKIPPSWLNYDLRVLVNTVSVHSKNYDPRAPQKKLDELFISHLNIMITSLMSMKNAQYFFDVRKTRLYFPDFCSMYRKEFVDIRTILLKCQAGMYTSILQVIIDIKHIPYLVRIYARNNNNPELIQNASLFEMEFNSILRNTPFAALKY